MKITKEKYKVVLWGWKDHFNTFHYIHFAYNRTFKYLGYDVYWFDDNTDISNFDFKNTLFFTEGQVDKNIPLRDDCFYVLHNCDQKKYKELLNRNKCIQMQTYTDDVLKYNYSKLGECIYADYEGKCIYFHWPTDLLPHEIEKNKPNVAFNSESKFVHWVGTIGGEYFGNIDQIAPFKSACLDNGITFTNRMLVSQEENINLIQQSYMAPTIAGKWQFEVGYVPCRITKNISYGQMGITNSPRIYELFDRKIIFNTSTYDLFSDAKQYLEKMPVSELHSLMDYVKENQTYINRINTIIDFIDKTT
jgi:hypothetical protein